MDTDLIKYLAVGAGFLMIVAATVLALRQSISWHHVVIFSLGGVLAGISGVQLQAGKDDWKVSIGQLASATDQASMASEKQSDAIAALNQRVDQLQVALETARSAGRPPAGAAPPAPPSAQARSDVIRNLNSSRTLSSQAGEIAKRLSRGAF